jgi:serine/tyrosine/threonine adenylyltransferase
MFAFSLKDGAVRDMGSAVATKDSAGWRLEHSYAQLPGAFYVEVEPSPVLDATVVALDTVLAGELGLDPEGLLAVPGIFTGNELPPGARPLAQAYAGHQYGHFTMLGDGRAILLGEQITPLGLRYDVQLKGSGPTPFSRRGDGRAGLGPMLREFIMGQAMHALGIPTTRSLAVATTGEKVYRQTPQLGAVLTRVAASHIRVGTFEWAASREDVGVLKTLADYTIGRHYPELVGQGYLAFLNGVTERQALLLAEWMCVGFIHGVMNTDNMAVSGETIDYGPCAFMDGFSLSTVFSSIDHHGRYAYGNQPRMAQWNLARLAEALLPLLHDDEREAVALGNEAVEGFQQSYEGHWLGRMREKLGLFHSEPEDVVLVDELFELLEASAADFTMTFAALSRGESPEHLAAWLPKWRARQGRQSQSLAEAEGLMQRRNPAYIPRNHLVEAALAAAVERGDMLPMERLLEVLRRPFDHISRYAEFSHAAAGGCAGYQTFCGT